MTSWGNNHISPLFFKAPLFESMIFTADPGSRHMQSYVCPQGPKQSSEKAKVPNWTNWTKMPFRGEVFSEFQGPPQEHGTPLDGQRDHRFCSLIPIAIAIRMPKDMGVFFGIGSVLQLHDFGMERMR